MKKIILVGLCSFLLYAFCLAKTDGFSIGKISSDLSWRPEWETKKEPIEHLLDQPFYYLAHGAQVYAFVSEDNTTVLKFYRHNRASHLLKSISFLLPPLLKNRLSKTIEKRRAKRVKDFTSYKLAAEKLGSETGLIYAHLNKSSHLHKKLILFDKIGVRHILNPDQFEFILQKRASLFYPTLERWIEEGSYDLAKRALTHLVDLIRIRCRKGIFDKDPDLMTNFGFIDETPIQFDIGRFKEDPGMMDPKMQLRELQRITDRLSQWLDERAPELSEHLRKEITL